MYLSIIGFVLIISMMVVLIKEWLAPSVAFVLLPLLAAFVAGFGVSEIGDFVNSGLNTMLGTSVLFIFSISYFTLMSEQGLFEPIIDWLLAHLGKSLTLIFMAVSIVTFVAHLDGSGAATYLITVPAFIPIMRKMNVRPEALLGVMAAMMATMNVEPWAGPTLRAASVAKIEPMKLFLHILPSFGFMLLMALGISYFISRLEVMNGAKVPEGGFKHDSSSTKEEGLKVNKSLYFFNLFLTIGMLALLLIDILPMHFVFMVAFSLALTVNYRSVKEQSKKLKSFAPAAINMTMTLFAVGVFMGIISESGMVKEMAKTLVAILPSFITPHMHWFMALFCVPLLMVLGTDAFYFALLPIIIGVVKPFGITPLDVASAFLLTGTYGTFVSPSVAAVYVGLGLADSTIGKHIKYSLRILWPASIVSLIIATLLGVVKF
ncbi:citrate transporter [Atopobacter sp. AH10]|uniref:SLC13 family permease n=1 Tax=Atopobacter sp. AH10 TaxID=2315861 RepID=UPI000EF21DA5|nr:SLC13 family permease [Atopobacter sp. AH10]RLK64018.1 citrate transporter [Atopobacter sp. AH10]